MPKTSLHSKQADVKTILIIACGEHFTERMQFVKTLQQESPYQIAYVHTYEQGWEFCQGERPNLLVFLNCERDQHCMEWYERMQSDDEDASIPALLLAEGEIEQEAMQKNVVYLHKPFSGQCLQQTLDALIALPRSNVGVV